MRPLTSRRRIAAAVIGFFAALVPLARAEAGLVIYQRSNGIPGASGTAEKEYKLLVGTGKLALIDESSSEARRVIARIDRQVYWEIDPKLEEYRELEFAEYRRKRDDAERDRDKARRTMLDKHEKGIVSDAELDEWLKERGVRKDGARRLEVKKGPLVPDGGARKQLVSIEVNGVTQVAVWQTDRYEGKYAPPQELFDFYDQTRLFPEDVTSALKREVTLFPIEIYADIDFFSAGATITTSVRSVGEWTEEPERFELPKGYRKVDEFSKEKLAAKEWSCPVCGKKVDPLETKYHLKLPDPETKRDVKHFFDSEDCMIEFSQNPAPSKRP
jgi:YHS domain-containing protein